MKTNVVKVVLAIVVTLACGYNVYSSQKTECVSDLVLANIEALASGEGGPAWKGYYTDYNANCCRISPNHSDECGGSRSPCPGEY